MFIFTSIGLHVRAIMLDDEPLRNGWTSHVSQWWSEALAITLYALFQIWDRLICREWVLLLMGARVYFLLVFRAMQHNAIIFAE